MSEQATWRVRILDLSGGAEDNIVEEIGPFASIDDANLFARRYVRDSVERCRAPGMDADGVLHAWFAFGEDAIVPEAGERGWRSAAELHDFAARQASRGDRDWRSLDPRGYESEDES
jgi:hypothetical protein